MGKFNPLIIQNWHIFSCDQAALWTVLSVCLSHLMSMFPSSYHHQIFRMYWPWQNWCPCTRSRSKVKVTKVTTII